MVLLPPAAPGALLYQLHGLFRGHLRRAKSLETYLADRMSDSWAYNFLAPQARKATEKSNSHQARQFNSSRAQATMTESDNSFSSASPSKAGSAPPKVACHAGNKVKVPPDDATASTMSTTTVPGTVFGPTHHPSWPPPCWGRFKLRQRSWSSTRSRLLTAPPSN